MMARSFVKRFLKAIREQAFMPPGQQIGVAVSGGADSVALLRLLLELREEMGIVLSVVHFNHKLRGRAAGADEKFVAKLAGKHGLEFHVERSDIAAKAKREKANLEDTARRARYDFFSSLVAERKVDRVAVAHTADDQAETVLAHILRGTGLSGLGGIYPETECVVRPLLHVRRAELRAYLRSKKQKWREDATNQDTTRMRARIRKKLIPLLEKEFQPAAAQHLASLAEFAREDERFMDSVASERCAALVRREGRGTRIAVSDLLSPMGNGNFDAKDAKNTKGREQRRREETYVALTKRIVRRLIEESKHGAGQITAQHIARVMELSRHGQSGKALQLPGGVEVRREREELVFWSDLASISEKKRGAAHSSVADWAEYEYEIEFRNGTATVPVPQTGCVFRLRVIDWPTNREQTRESGTVLDRDRLRLPLVLRNWRPGDRLQPTGHQKEHKLKRLLNEKHIGKWERNGWPVLTSGETLVWARGFPVAVAFAASEQTRVGISIAEEKS